MSNDKATAHKLKRTMGEVIFKYSHVFYNLNEKYVSSVFVSAFVFIIRIFCQAVLLPSLKSVMQINKQSKSIFSCIKRYNFCWQDRPKENSKFFSIAILSLCALL